MLVISLGAIDETTSLACRMNDDLLNFAVLAFAVDDMKDLESSMTSAKPLAFLRHVNHVKTRHAISDLTSGRGIIQQV